MPAQPSTDLALWQEHLDFLLPRKPTLRADEIAAAVGLDARTVERAFEGPQHDAQGRMVRPWLTGFAFNAAGGQRFARRIPRRDALLWLAHCANYEPGQHVTALTEVMATLSLRELVLFQQRLAELIKRRQAAG
jgi:hypothetical protein